MTWKFRSAIALTFNGGYVDTAGFLALHGLFVAHVTGNFVTAGASIFRGTSGAAAQLLALPVFCLAVMLVRFASARLMAEDRTTLQILLGSQVALLALGGAIAIAFGPFPDGDRPAALCTGMTLVVAMAVQNAAHRIHLAEAPPSTLVTGSITQLMTNFTDILLAHGSAPRPHVALLATSVVAFGLGCASAACLYAFTGPWCFALPPVLAFVGMRLVCDRRMAPVPNAQAGSATLSHP